MASDLGNSACKNIDNSFEKKTSNISTNIFDFIEDTLNTFESFI